MPRLGQRFITNTQSQRLSKMRAIHQTTANNAQLVRSVTIAATKAPGILTSIGMGDKFLSGMSLVER